MPKISSKERKRRRRAKLFDAQDGKCFWCGCDMVHFTSPDGILPPNACTLDHVFPRTDYRRRQGYFLALVIPTAVAACFNCNNMRGDTEFERWVQKTGRDCGEGDKEAQAPSSFEDDGASHLRYGQGRGH